MKGRLIYCAHRKRGCGVDLYFGDVSLCYTNSLAMALDSYGFRFRPEYLEALMVMGNGASVVEHDA